MKIIITAGGTEEPIDSVRKITNIGTGKLGSKIANRLSLSLKKSDTIYYICNKNSIMPVENENIKIILTTDTDSVIKAFESLKYENIDFVIHSMAISDYKVEGAYIEEDSIFKKIDTSSKMKSNNDEIFLKLVRTPKIVDKIKNWFPKTKLISFKLLNNVSSEELLNVAKKQKERTNSDLVIANDLSKIRGGNHIGYFIGDTLKEVRSKEKISKEEFK